MQSREVGIVGVYATEQAKQIDRTSIDLALEALLGGLDDAGLTPQDVDGIAMEWPGPSGLHGESSSWAKVLGHGFRWTAQGIDIGGVRGVAVAAAAISAGLCETVVLGGARAGQDTDRRVLHEFSAPWGTWGAVGYAMIARRHMFEFGTTSEQLAEVASTIRNHGHVNPEAVMYNRGPYSVDDILNSPLVAEPFHLLDMSLFAQGGAVVVITTADRAKDLRQPPISLLAAGIEIQQANYVNPPLYRESGQIGRETAKRVLGQAGVQPTDIDLLCLYDPNSFEIIRQLETIGLCAEGEGGSFVQDGAIGLGGEYPTNPDGGLLSYAWCGMQAMTLKVVECVKQLRGQAGLRQVRDAEIAVASAAGAGSHHWEFGVFGRL